VENFTKARETPRQHPISRFPLGIRGPSQPLATITPSLLGYLGISEVNEKDQKTRIWLKNMGDHSLSQLSPV
jgi:hypothetical protein